MFSYTQLTCLKRQIAMHICAFVDYFVTLPSEPQHKQTYNDKQNETRRIEKLHSCNAGNGNGNHCLLPNRRAYTPKLPH